MLLTISTTRAAATDLGWLLRKRPTKVQSFDLSFGKAHVFYPEATDERCTAALVLDVDPIGLVRGRRGPAGEGFSLEQYVNDRPYAASSFMSVAIAQVFGTALGGRCKDRPELVEEVWPLEVGVGVLPSRGGENLLRKLFEPLGYEVTATRHTLDVRFADWGESHYFTVTLRGQKRVKGTPNCSDGCRSADAALGHATDAIHADGRAIRSKQKSWYYRTLQILVRVLARGEISKYS